jgi:hypothetical protein
MADITPRRNSWLQLIIIAGLLAGSFLGAYAFASARGGAAQASIPVASEPQQSTPPDSGAPDPSADGDCECCDGGGATTDNGVTGDPDEGSARVSGGVQAIGVQVGATYSPNIIKLEAGIPAEITFGQGGGCTAQVVSEDLGFSADLSTGPQVIKLPAPKKGTYSFSCGMGMVFGKIVVE